MSITTVPTQTSTLLGADFLASPVKRLDQAGFKNFTYLPFGYSCGRGIGFTGQMTEASTSGYLLGNGYRCYLPTLFRFVSSDSYSPFTSGGLNSYIYTGADPINNTDPSGHMAGSLIKGLKNLFSRTPSIKLIEKNNKIINYAARIDKRLARSGIDQYSEPYIDLLKRFKPDRNFKPVKIRNAHDNQRYFVNDELIGKPQTEEAIQAIYSRKIFTERLTLNNAILKSRGKLDENSILGANILNSPPSYQASLRHSIFLSPPPYYRKLQGGLPPYTTAIENPPPYSLR